MSYLLDTNILLRIAQRSHPMSRDAREALALLRRRKESVHIVPQNLYEMWVVATRPLSANGLGLDITQARVRIRRAETFLKLIPDVPGIYPEWRRLVEQYSVSGRSAHDARLVAAMKIHGATHLLTFNTPDFKAYHKTEIIVTSPAEVLATSN